MRRPSKRQLMQVMVAALLAGAMVILLQMWFAIFDSSMFWKLQATCTLVIAVAGVLLAFFSDIEEEDKQKKDNYLG